MHAIQRYHYNRLRQFLQQLHLESKTLELPADHVDTIISQERKLQQLYSNYLDSLNQVSRLIKQYEQENILIRRLMNSHKKHCKQIQRK